MKKILIIGASGSLAKEVITELHLQTDIELTLFARNSNRISDKGNDKIIVGDAMNYEAVKSAVSGQDIVYINLAGNLDAMTKNIVKAMQESGVNRVIAISSIGIYEAPLKSVLKPYRALADVIETSGLDYTILRPDWFTHGNEVDYHITKMPDPEVGGAVSRKSIAAFVASIISHPDKYCKENLGISRLN